MEWMFDICCQIMSSLGHFFGLSYKEICVIGNIYIQGGIWVLSTIVLLIATIKKKRKGVFSAGTYTVFCIFIMSYFCIRYAPPLAEAFDKCVADLRTIADLFHTTYEVVNIVIFVILWLVFVIMNLVISLRNSKKP